MNRWLAKEELLGLMRSIRQIGAVAAGHALRMGSTSASTVNGAGSCQYAVAVLSKQPFDGVA
ncbi:MAG: hypothetical protein ABL985_06455 [Casimicrobium sp.]